MDAEERSGDLIGENEENVWLSSLSTFRWWRGGGGSRRKWWTMKVVHED